MEKSEIRKLGEWISQMSWECMPSQVQEAVQDPDMARLLFLKHQVAAVIILAEKWCGYPRPDQNIIVFPTAGI